MDLDLIFQLINFGVNTGFMVISIIILIVFLQRFEGNVQYTKPNISGLILMALGLIFHILGNLSAQLLSGIEQMSEQFYTLTHLIASFISLSVVMFIIGTALILYHIAPQEHKPKVKIFGWVFFVLGLIDTIYHFIFFFTEQIPPIFGITMEELELFYLFGEMILLVVIYFFLYLQSRKSVSKIVGARYRLISITAIGFVLVIIADIMIKLSFVDFGSFISFLIFFILHVITVGALYLLVLFPDWYKVRLEIIN